MAEIFKHLIDSMKAGENKGVILRSMATFASIEFCGTVLTGKVYDYNPNSKKKISRSEKNFSAFCKSDYMPAEYHKISLLLYKLFRCGAMHTYIPKGAAFLTGDPSMAGKHLKFDIDGLVIYLPKLTEDVSNAIKKFRKDVSSLKNMTLKFRSIIKEIEKEGIEIYKKFLRDNNIIPKRLFYPIQKTISRDRP